MNALEAIRNALGGEAVMMSPRGLAAAVAKAGSRVGQRAPWELREDGRAGGVGAEGEDRKTKCLGDPEDPTWPDFVRSIQMEMLGCPVERRKTADGREAVIVRVEGAIAFDATVAWWWGGVWTPALCDILGRLAEEAELGLSTSPVVLAFNCPGGQHKGLTELTAAMKRLSAARPVVALANEGMYSLAYEFGCLARMVVATKTAGVGSIGSMLTLTSVARMNEEMGIDVRTVKSGDLKDAGDPDKAITQGDVDYFAGFIAKAAGEFFSIVAGARGISEADVQAMEAGWFVGDDAKAAKLVDKVIDDVPTFLDSISAKPRGSTVLVRGGGGGGDDGCEDGSGGDGGGAGDKGRDGSDVLSRREKVMYKTVQELRDACGPLVQQIEKTAHDKAMEQAAKDHQPKAATLDELRSKFVGPDLAAFREECLGKKLTLTDALAAHGEMLATQVKDLTAKLAESTERLEAVGKGAEADAAAIPGDPGKDATGGAGGGAGVGVVAGVKLEGPALRFHGALSKAVAALPKGGKVSEAIRSCKNADEEGHKAYTKAGSPGLSDLKPAK